jgi:hypothetical protein
MFIFDFSILCVFFISQNHSFRACFHFRNCNRIAHHRPPRQSAPASAPPPPVLRTVHHQQQHHHLLHRPLLHRQLHRSRSREHTRGRVAPILAAVCFQVDMRMTTTNQVRQTLTLVAAGKQSTFKSSNSSSGHPAAKSMFATRIYSRPPLRPPPSPPHRRRPVRSISARTARRARDQRHPVPRSLRSALCRVSRRHAGGSDAVNYNHRKNSGIFPIALHFPPPHSYNFELIISDNLAMSQDNVCEN